MTTKTANSEAPLGCYRERREADMHDIQNDYWTARAGRFVSVAQVVRLTAQYNREMGVGAWKKRCRVIGNKKAYRVPGTAEHGKLCNFETGARRYIASALKLTPEPVN